MEWVYLAIGILLLILLLGIFSSCAVVRTDYSSNAKKNATVYYYLPEGNLKISAHAKAVVVYDADSSLTDGSYVIEESFSVSTEMIADTKNLLSLNYKPNALMADDIKYAVNSKGLLETVNITTEDRSAAIIAKIAEAPQIILSAPAVAGRGKNIVKIKEFTSDFIIKASEISNTAFTVKWNLTILNELGIDESPKTVPADFTISSDDLSANPPPLSTIINESNSRGSEIEGILTRPLKNIPLQIKSAVNGVKFNATLPTYVMIPDVTKVIIIPVNRTAFVSRINKIAIQDGIILSNEITKPSSVEGFISIPVNVAKAVISIPAQLVQFRYDNTKRLNDLETAKLEFEKSILESKKFALTKEQEIDKVKLEIAKTDLSNNIELQKFMLTLQTSLLQAQEGQLKAEKALEDIKKEIEELKQKK